MDNLSFLLGLNANNGGGGGGSTPTWSEVTGKPFSTVDTTNGLTIVDGTLMLETLDHVATIDYVDGQIDGITTTLESDYALKSEIPDTSSFITASALTPYVEASSLTTVAYSGSYNDLEDKPTIPTATQVTVTQGLTTGVEIGSIDVDGVTTSLYAPQGGGGTAPTPDWSATSGQDGYIDNKPNVFKGNSGTGTVKIGSTANNPSGLYAVAEGANTIASGSWSHAEGANTKADSSWSHAEGFQTEAYGTAMHAQGQWNVKGSTNMYNFYADVIGNGTADNARSNAEATDWDGNKYLAGNIYVGVTNWASPTTGAACIPPQADFDWAEANGYVINNSDEGSVDWAQDIIDNQSYDEWGQPEYTGEIDTVYAFKYYINHTIHNESTGEDDKYDGYYWGCQSADPVPNPNYNVDPNSEEPEEEPEP